METEVEYAPKTRILLSAIYLATTASVGLLMVLPTIN